MKNNFFYTIGLIVLSMVAFATGPSEAQTTANGPYYATPSWDQKLRCDTQATCPRFVVLSNWSNAAVLDRETGLVWERSPSTSQMEWQLGHNECNNLKTGGRLGWRLPTIQELMSLLDASVLPFPTLPSGHPFIGVQSGTYWSATALPNDLIGNSAWRVDFIYGVANNAGKGENLFVWCVRGGQGVDAQ